MHNVADEFIDAIQERLETNEVVDMKPLFQALSLDTIANCAFGVHTNSFKHPNNALFKRCQDLFSDMRVKNATESSLIFLGSYFPKIMEWIDLFGLENFEYLFDTTKVWRTLLFSSWAANISNRPYFCAGYRLEETRT